MDLRTFIAGLSAADLATFASESGTTPQMLKQIARGHKRVELGFADALVAVSRGAITLDELPLTERAQAQRVIRETRRRRVVRRPAVMTAPA